MVKLPKMQIKDVGVSIGFVLFFWSFLGMTLEDNKVIIGVLSEFYLNSASEDSYENLVEVLAFRCSLELIHVKQVYENLNNLALTNEIVRDLNKLDSQKKQNLYNCFRDNFITSPISGEDARPVSWFHKYLDSHFPKLTPNADSRRLLAQAPSKSPGSKPKAPKDDFDIPISGFESLSTEEKGSGNSARVLAEGNGGGGNESTSVAVIVVVTALVTLFVAVNLFCCFQKAFIGDLSLTPKDDRPLLSLTTSDYSASGSPPKAWDFENSVQKDKLSSNLSSTSIEFAATDNSKESSNSNVLPPLKPPPGRSNSNLPPLKPPPGRTVSRDPRLPPLRPPPGRAQPLPPEPPASLRLPSSTGGPPPPPAAPPPPSLSPSPPPKNSGPPPPGPPPPPPVRGGKPGPGPPPPPMKKSQVARVSVKAGSSSANEDDASKTKLKPFFWDKVQANSEQSMVWDQLKAGSFQFNEEMIESLFGYVAPDNKNEKKKQSAAHDAQPQFIQLIDQKKAQNLAILLRAMNVTTDEVRDALIEGNELPTELLETLLKMAPTQEEELKLRLFNGEISQLGPAERFLKVLVDIPFAFRRLETLLFMGMLQEESTSLKESLITLEAACKELRNSRLFLKLLEAVLKTGNRMNDGTYRGGAQAFKLDTLLKLADVKGTDGKTTLLHFVVQEIIRTEGVRAVRTMCESQSFSSIKTEDLLEEVCDESEEHYRTLGLQVVSGLSGQLENVKKAAGLDSDTVTGNLARLGDSLIKAKNFLGKEMKEVDEDNGFHEALKSFIEHSEGDIKTLLDEEKRIMALVKHTTDYFHGNSGKEEGLRLFVIVRDFLIILDRVCREVKEKARWPARDQKKRDPPSRQTSTETPRTSFSPDFQQKLFPAIAQQRTSDDAFSSDDD